MIIKKKQRQRQRQRLKRHRRSAHGELFAGRRLAVEARVSQLLRAVCVCHLYVEIHMY